MIIHNPIVPGNFADPESRMYNGRYYIYATQSKSFELQNNLTAFVSDDLVSWQELPDIINMQDFPGTWGAVWAPSVVEKNGKYYIIFATNCLRVGEPKDSGGLHMAVADKPEGPFFGYMSRPLIGEYINGAQPIDAHLFKDDDGTVYLYYGGVRHCNVAVMNDKMDGFVPFSDGECFHEITPPGYVEGPCMMKYRGSYYFQWSTGDWTKDDYGVMYTVVDSPVGPFTDGKQILAMQAPVAKGPGHHSYLYLPERDEFLIVYHRRNMDEFEGHSRHLCIDRMSVHDKAIDDIKMTFEFELGK